MRARAASFAIPALVAAAAAAGCARRDPTAAPPPAPAPTPHPAAAPPPDAPPPDAAPALPDDPHALALAVCPHVTAPYLFAVAKAGKTSYLLGTRHLGVGLDRMPPVVAADLAAARVAVFEVDPADQPPAAPDRPGPSLAAALGPDLWARYQALVGAGAAAALEHARPSEAIVAVLATFEDPSASLDDQLGQAAIAAHVPTRGLERAAFQDALLEQIMDVRALRGTIAITRDRAELRQDTADDLGAYCRGDSLAPTTKDEDDMRRAGYSDAEIARFDDELLFGRNRAWIPELEPMFDRGGAFVAVGLDHLLGERGLIAALTRDGYAVSRVAP